MTNNVQPFNFFEYISTISKEDFINMHASGTLRKGSSLGMLNVDMLIEEYVAYMFGYEFMAVPSSRVTIGEICIEGDQKEFTEFCWHTERAKTMFFNAGDVIPCYATYEDPEGNKTEGMAILINLKEEFYSNLRITIPKGRKILAFVSVFNQKEHCYESASSPF